MTQPRTGYPLYLQIKTWLLERIESGEWSEGSLIPSESELISTHGVSRTTIRLALLDLVAAGYLVRKQGRGTFVAKREHLITSSPLYGFREELELVGRDAVICALSVESVTAPDEVYMQLRIPDHSPVIKVTRTLCENGRPLLFDTSYLPTHLASNINETTLQNASIYSLMEASGIVIAAGEQAISAVCADEETARALDCKPGNAVLYVERVTRDKVGQPIEYTVAKFRPDSYEYRVRLTRKYDEGREL